MGCAASLESKGRKNNTRKGSKRDNGPPAHKGKKSNGPVHNAAPTAATVVKTPSKAKANPLSPAGAKSAEFSAVFVASADKNSDELSSISDDQTSRGTSRVNGSLHTVTTATVTSAIQPSSPGPKHTTTTTVAKSALKGKGHKGHHHHAERLSSVTSTTPSSEMSTSMEPKWKRQVQIKRSNLTKNREGPEGISANKLARIQKWIDYSDQGTSPLGPLLDPMNTTEQRAREARLRDYVQQGIPLYAQASSTDPVTEQERRRSMPVKKMLSIRVASKLKSRMANALSKAKRRQSHSVKIDMDLDESLKASGNKSGAVDGDAGVDDTAKLVEDDVSDGHDTSDRQATGSLANVGHDRVDVMSHAVLEDRD